MRILYIEDTAAHIRLVQRIVNPTSHELIIAVDGKQGLALARAVQPDALFVDLRLPDTDGLNLVRALRQSGCTAPIAAITASVANIDRQACLAAGCDLYLGKPYQVEELLELLADSQRLSESRKAYTPDEVKLPVASSGLATPQILDS